MIGFASLSKAFRRRQAFGGYPGLLDRRTLYVVGDIHGRSDCLDAVHRLIDRDKRENGCDECSTEIYLGDYIDRGPDSKGVIDRLLRRGTYSSAVFLRGNHEKVMQDFLSEHAGFETWRRLGGAETLLSYGYDGYSIHSSPRVRAEDFAASLPAEHRSFLDALIPFYAVGPYCFVHAGLRPGIPLEHQNHDDLVWIRDEFLAYEGTFGRIVVHGHTPVENAEFRPNRINIDTGAYLTNRLSVLKINAAGPVILAPTQNRRELHAGTQTQALGAAGRPTTAS